MGVINHRRPAFWGLLLIVLTVSTCQATPLVNARAQETTTFYVSPLGNDSNLGSLTQPWKTIQKAAETMLPGESVTVMAGNYDERVHVATSGIPGAPITFKASGTVLMRGFTIKASYITIDGFEITNTPDDPIDGIGIFVQGTNCIIEDNYIHYATRGGILLYVDPGNDAQTQDCIVRNNRLYRNAINGVEIHGINHLVENNEVWGTIQYHPNWQNPPAWVDADGMYFFGSDHIIRHNYIHDIHYGIPENPNPHIDCFQTWADSESAHDILFEQNICTNVDAQSPTEVGQGFMLNGARNLILRNNVIRAYRNINSVNSTNLSIVNNILTGVVTATTAYNPTGVSLTGSTYITVKNNAFYNLPGHALYLEDSISQQGLDVGYNSNYRNDGRHLWDPPYPHDLWGIDPAFVDPAAGNYTLMPYSTLIDAGTARTDVPNDFYGTPRPQGAGFDIGIYEYYPVRMTAVPCWARLGEPVAFGITFLASGSTIRITDTLPLELTYQSYNSGCGGGASYDPDSRQIVYSGAPSTGTGCTVQLLTRVDTDRMLAIKNTAILNDGQKPLQSLSAVVVLNGFRQFLPGIFKNSWLWGCRALKTEIKPNPCAYQAILSGSAVF